MARTPGFIFGGDTGVKSAEELARKREIVNALLDPSLTMPQTFGEGLTVFGRAIAGKLQDKKLGKQEDAERARIKDQISALTGSPYASTSGPTGAQRGGTGFSGDPRDPVNIAGDTMAALGKDGGTAGYRASLIGTESGGNWKAKNNEVGAGGKAGHYGRVQFGHARLQEAMDAGAIPQGTTPEQFMNSPALQIAAENWHFGDLESQLGDLVGTVVNGQPLDMGALVAMGHLGGAGGARKFVESGGAYNPADSFGTSLAEYATTHSGAPVTMSAKGEAATGIEPDMRRITHLAELAANSYADPGQAAVVSALLEAEMAKMQPVDPMDAIELERAQLELEALKNPSAPEPIKVGDVLLDPVTMQPIYDGRTPKAEPRPMTAQERAQWGIPESDKTPYKMTDAGPVAIGGGGTSVTVDMGGGSPDLGKLSTDYGYLTNPDGSIKRDPVTGLAISAPVPGSPAAIESERLANKGVKKDTQGKLKLGSTLENINLNIADVEDGGLPVTGVVGDARRTWLGRTLTGDGAVDFDNRTRQITDSAALAEIQNMRDNSPTGGAVGALTDGERVAIGNAVTAMNSSTSAEEYARAAKVYRQLALDTAYGVGMWQMDENGDVVAVSETTAAAPSDLGLSDDDLQYLEMP